MQANLRTYSVANGNMVESLRVNISNHTRNSSSARHMQSWKAETSAEYNVSGMSRFLQPPKRRGHAWQALLLVERERGGAVLQMSQYAEGRSHK
jgi:hypothetical protein